MQEKGGSLLSLISRECTENYPSSVFYKSWLRRIRRHLRAVDQDCYPTLSRLTFRRIRLLQGVEKSEIVTMLPAHTLFLHSGYQSWLKWRKGPSYKWASSRAGGCRSEPPLTRRWKWTWVNEPSPGPPDSNTHLGNNTEIKTHGAQRRVPVLGLPLGNLLFG